MSESRENIISFYEELEQRKTNPNAFEEWQKYRNCLTKFVCQGSDKASTLAIYGAGRCNDLDLQTLANHFSSITLIDMDEEAMNQALSRFCLCTDSRVNLRLCDFVGISENDYCNYVDAFISALEKCNYAINDSKLIVTVTQYLDYMYSKATAPTFTPLEFDYTLSAGLQSQLNSRAAFLWMEWLKSKGIAFNPNTDKVLARINRETTPMVNAFDDMLISSARKAVFTACELGIRGGAYGIQGAMQLQDDLAFRSFRNEIRPTAESTLCWPQNQNNNIVFDMLLQKHVILQPGRI